LLSQTFETQDELPLDTQLSEVVNISGKEFGMGKYFSAMAMQAELSSCGLLPGADSAEFTSVPESEEQAKRSNENNNNEILKKFFILNL
jgi:hypothetical protein